MAEAGVAAAYGVETVLEGAVALAKGIYHPTLPLKAHLKPLRGIDLPRAHHTLSVIKGRAYVFGGRNGVALADNAMHIIVLPSSGVEGLDYRKIPVVPESPPARYGHSATTIDDSIYVFGGFGENGEPLQESGKVWAFNTITNTWTALFPHGDDVHPAPRAENASAASIHPQQALQRTDQNTLPQAPPDPADIVPEPPSADTYGTIFIRGGTGPSNVLYNDLWAFDVSTRTWSELSGPSQSSGESPSLSLVGNRLYSFTAGQIAHVDFSSDPPATETEAKTMGIQPLGPWTNISQAADGVERPNPGVRTGSLLIPVTTGQGRHYLALFGGKTIDNQTADDIWTLQLKPESMTAASWKDAARNMISKDTREEHWEEVKYHDSDGVLLQESQPGRGVGTRVGLAGAKGSEVDGASVVLWGGIDDSGKTRSDGLLVTVDR